MLEYAIISSLLVITVILASRGIDVLMKKHVESSSKGFSSHSFLKQ